MVFLGPKSANCHTLIDTFSRQRVAARTGDHRLVRTSIRGNVVGQIFRTHNQHTHFEEIQRIRKPLECGAVGLWLFVHACDHRQMDKQTSHYQLQFLFNGSTFPVGLHGRDDFFRRFAFELRILTKGYAFCLDNSVPL